MKWIGKIGSLIVSIGIIAYLIMSLAFTSSQMQDQKVSEISVEVHDRDQVNFVEEDQVVQALVNRHVNITNQPIDSINKAYVKDVVLDMSHVKDAEIFFTPDGVFHIQVRQRIPIMRVISGKLDFYVDESGQVFPVSDLFTAKVPVFTGNITNEIIQGSLLKLSAYLHANDFWGSMIDQIQVWSAGDIELVPRLGNHRIFLGDVDNLDWKFAKLRAVYDKALPVVGWDKYKSIDLRFGDQVVCKNRNES